MKVWTIRILGRIPKGPLVVLICPLKLNIYLIYNILNGSWIFPFLDIPPVNPLKKRMLPHRHETEPLRGLLHQQLRDNILQLLGAIRLKRDRKSVV